MEDARLSFGDRVVFEGVSANFAPHRVTALVGPSGSGKTSLLSAIAGYLSLTGGTITRVDPATGEGGAPDPDSVAWVPQGSNALGARSVLDNVVIAALSRGLELMAARRVALTCLHQVGLRQHTRQVAGRLSGGELQRVSIARALASGRPIILADEPSANLDQVNTIKLGEVLRDLSTTSTVIVATHDPILVDAATDVVHLRGER